MLHPILCAEFTVEMYDEMIGASPYVKALTIADKILLEAKAVKCYYCWNRTESALTGFSFSIEPIGLLLDFQDLYKIQTHDMLLQKLSQL